MLESLSFLVKERVTFLKTTDIYDIYDAETGEEIGIAIENPGSLVSTLRWFVSKRLMPTRIEVREYPDESLVFSMTRGVNLFRQRVEVRDSQETLIGYFKSKMFSFGGGFHVYDANDRLFAEVKGNFVGYQFRFLTPDGDVIGEVSKKFEGFKTIFTSSDTYLVEIDEELEGQPLAKMLLLAAALAIDIVYYEGN